MSADKLYRELTGDFDGLYFFIGYVPVTTTGKWRIKRDMWNNTALYLEIVQKHMGLFYFKHWVHEKELCLGSKEKAYINDCG